MMVLARVMMYMLQQVQLGIMLIIDRVLRVTEMQKELHMQ